MASCSSCAITSWVGEICGEYSQFIMKNPSLATELESALRYFSYFASAGHFKYSQILSELLFSASKLLTLLNDSILRKSANITLHLNPMVERLQTALVVLQYSEVFVEITALRAGGNFCRWFVVVSVQLIKTTLRLLLLLKYKQGIQKHNPILQLDRKADLPSNVSGPNEMKSEACRVEAAFKLRKSGRTIRSLAATPPLERRTWQLPNTNGRDKEITRRIKLPPSPLTKEKLLAEVIYILRPLSHLAAMGFFGEKSWKPWLLALGMDVGSLQLLGDRRHLNLTERLELSHRALVLLFYVLRSPFYDQYSKDRIFRGLKFSSEHIPLVGYLLRPLMNYLPEWQSTYFYVWDL